jgi:hypothetical protein
MRYWLASGLLVAGLLAAIPAFNHPCHTHLNRLSWVIGAGFLVGLSALMFASHPRMPAAGAWAIAAGTTVVAILGIGLLAAVWWAASGCAN